MLIYKLNNFFDSEHLHYVVLQHVEINHFVFEMIQYILCNDKGQDRDVLLCDYDRNYLIQIRLDIIDRGIYVFHNAYDIVIGRMFEMIVCIFDNDMFVYDDDNKHYYEMNAENRNVVFDYEFEHEEYNRQVYQIIENKLHLNNERLE